MRKHRQLGFALVTVVAAAAALAGCGGSSGSNDSSNGTVSVNFWQTKYEDYQQKWFGKYVKAFNASQKKVHINYLVVPADTWAQKLKAAQAAHTQPDIATTNYGSIPP